MPSLVRQSGRKLSKPSGQAGGSRGAHLHLPRPGQWSPRARVVLSQPPSGDSAQRKLLGLVAQSADFVDELARAQLPDSEEVARAAAEAEAEAQLAAQKLESRRLRRSWDARLSWRR